LREFSTEHTPRFFVKKAINNHKEDLQDEAYFDLVQPVNDSADVDFLRAGAVNPRAR
jgi:hypothetical protein